MHLIVSFNYLIPGLLRFMSISHKLYLLAHYQVLPPHIGHENITG